MRHTLQVYKMFRNPTVVSDRMSNGARVFRVLDAPGVSFWELKDSNEIIRATAPHTIGGFIAFETDYSGDGVLVPVTLKGTVYREGVLIGPAD